MRRNDIYIFNLYHESIRNLKVKKNEYLFRTIQITLNYKLFYLILTIDIIEYDYF